MYMIFKMPETYTCAKCGKVAKTKQALERHAAYHEDDRPFSCEVCLQRFKNSDDRGKHYRRLRRDGKFAFACQVCHKHFKSQDLLSKHWEILGCLLKQVKTNENLEVEPSSTVGGAEEKRSGPNQPIEELVLENDVKCSCKVCERVFIGTDNLKKHYKEEHNDTKRQVCIQCGQTLSSKDSLARHYSIFHQNKYPFQCDFCDQKFKIKESLCRHIKFVHKDGGYPCEICKRVFSQPVNLKKHMAMHSNSLDFSCHVCGREFRWKQAYQKHMALHRDSNHPDLYMKSETLAKDSELLNEVTEAIDTVHEIEVQLENDNKTPSSFGGNLIVSDSRLIDNTPQFPRNQMTNQMAGLSSDYDQFTSVSGNPTSSSLPLSLPSSVTLPVSLPVSLQHSGPSHHQRQQLQEQPLWSLSPNQTNRQFSERDDVEKSRKGNLTDIHDRVNNPSERFNNKNERFNNSDLRSSDSRILSGTDEISQAGLAPISSQSDLDLMNGNASYSQTITGVNTVQKTITSDIGMSNSVFLEPRLKDVRKDLPPGGKEKVQAWQVDVTHDLEPPDSANVTNMPTDEIDDLCDIEPIKIDLPKVSALKMDSYLGGKHKLNSGMNDTTLSWKKARIFGRNFGYRSDDSRSETSSTTGSTSGTSGSSGGSSRNNLKELKSKAILKARKELYFTSVPTSEQVTAPRYVFKPSSIQGVLKTTKPESDPPAEPEEIAKDKNQKPDFKTILDNVSNTPRKINNPFLIAHTDAKEKSLAALLEPRPDNNTVSDKGDKKEKPVPQIPGAYKFSLVKHMLTLKNEENFDKELFRNPLYSMPADLKGLSKLVERHKVKETGAYDLSARQVCPFQWIGGLKVNKDEKSTSSKNTNSKSSSIDVQDFPEDLSTGKPKSIEPIEESDDDINDNASDYSYREGKEELVIDVETGRFEKKPSKTPEPIDANSGKAMNGESNNDDDDIFGRTDEEMAIENVDEIENIDEIENVDEIHGKFEHNASQGQEHSVKAISQSGAQHQLASSESPLRAFDMMKDLIKCTKYTTNALNVDLDKLEKARPVLRNPFESADNSNTGFNPNISNQFERKGETGVDRNSIGLDSIIVTVRSGIDVNLNDQFEPENVTDGHRIANKRHIKVPCKSIGGDKVVSWMNNTLGLNDTVGSGDTSSNPSGKRPTACMAQTGLASGIDFELDHLTPSISSSMNSNFAKPGKHMTEFDGTGTTLNVTGISKLNNQGGSTDIGSSALVTQSFIPNSRPVFSTSNVPIMSERSDSLAPSCHGNKPPISNTDTMSTMFNQFRESKLTPEEREISKTIVEELNEVLCSSLQNDQIHAKIGGNMAARDDVDVTNDPTSLSGRQLNRAVSVDTNFTNRRFMSGTRENSMGRSFALNINNSSSTYSQGNLSNSSGSNSSYVSRNPSIANPSGSSYVTRNPSNLGCTGGNYSSGNSVNAASNSSSNFSTRNSLNVSSRSSNSVTGNPLNVAANVPNSNYISGNSLPNEVIDLSDINNQDFREVTMDIGIKYRQSVSNGSTSVPYLPSSGSVTYSGSSGSVVSSGRNGSVAYSVTIGSAAAAASSVVSRSWSVDSSASSNVAPQSFIDTSLPSKVAPRAFVGSTSIPSNHSSRSWLIDSGNIDNQLQGNTSRSVYNLSTTLTSSNISRSFSVDSNSKSSNVVPRSFVESASVSSNMASRSFVESASISSYVASRSCVESTSSLSNIAPRLVMNSTSISSNVAPRSFVHSSGTPSSLAPRSFVESASRATNIASRSWSMDARSPNLSSDSGKSVSAQLLVRQPQTSNGNDTNQKEDISILDLLKSTTTVKDFEPLDQLLEPCL